MNNEHYDCSKMTDTALRRLKTKVNNSFIKDDRLLTAVQDEIKRRNELNNSHY